MVFMFTVCIRSSACFQKVIMMNQLICIITQADTEVCKQVFSWLLCYAKHMNRYIYLSLLLIYICDLHNAHEVPTCSCNIIISMCINTYYVELL